MDMRQKVDGFEKVGLSLGVVSLDQHNSFWEVYFQPGVVSKVGQAEMQDAHEPSPPQRDRVPVLLKMGLLYRQPSVNQDLVFTRSHLTLTRDLRYNVRVRISGSKEIA
jgi:hypothetical protein